MTKIEQLIKKHKVVTREVADGTFTYDNNPKAIDFLQISGEIIAMELAKYQCESCKVKENLTIHHLITRNNKGTVPDNKYFSQRRYFFNICILCNNCHAKIHKFSKEILESISKERIEKNWKELN